MSRKSHIIFWIAVVGLLSVIFGIQSSSWSQAFFYVTSLLPIILITSYFFNYYLVPRYLLNGKTLQFCLYATYMVIVSLFFEMLIVFAALALLVNYNMNALSPFATNIIGLTSCFYLVVLLHAFLIFIYEHRKSASEIAALKSAASEKEIDFVEFKVKGGNARPKIEKILYFESLSDYVKIHQENKQLITREKISHLEKRLPQNFVRVHRSFIVNATKVNLLNKESIQIGKQTIPIGRTYKKQVSASFNNL